jgi:hypothetical protein
MMTKREGAILSAFTGITCGPFCEMHALAEELLGRSVLTHEFANQALCDELKEKVRPLFVDICSSQS